MKTLHPSPALVISLIALFIALGGTSYAALNALPKNSVGTKQIKNGAVTGPKLGHSVLKDYVHVGGTLPSGRTEVGDWGGGGIEGTDGGGGVQYTITSFPVPLATVIDSNHTIYVSGASATHCSGAGHANAGYLCVYDDVLANAAVPVNASIYNPEAVATGGTGEYGFGIFISASGTDDWSVSGTYAVTAP